MKYEKKRWVAPIAAIGAIENRKRFSGKSRRFPSRRGMPKILPGIITGVAGQRRGQLGDMYLLRVPQSWCCPDGNATGENGDRKWGLSLL